MNAFSSSIRYRETTPPTYGENRFGPIHSSGQSPEAETVNLLFIEAVDSYFEPLSRVEESPADRFYNSLVRWQDDVKHLSDTNEICTHPEYQAIIGMGREALPLIFAVLPHSSDYWFWALKAITRQDPVPATHVGRVRKMKEAWIAWGKAHGYVE